MNDLGFHLINEEFYARSVTPGQLDMLLADAWRHFGPHFFRYSLGIYEDEIRRVIPLRIRVADFKLSKNQRRILRKNADLDVEVRPTEITSETHELFERHKHRFKTGIPDTLFDFLSRNPAHEPADGLAVVVRRGTEMLASSFFELGETSSSSIYGIFAPEETSRSLGIFTMLKEIEYAADHGKPFYYHGYAYDGESYYDYKKRFSGLEYYDWDQTWLRFE